MAVGKAFFLSIKSIELAAEFQIISNWLHNCIIVHNSAHLVHMHVIGCFQYIFSTCQHLFIVFGPYLGNWALLKCGPDLRTTFSENGCKIISDHPGPFFENVVLTPPHPHPHPLGWNHIFRKWVQNDQWSSLTILENVVLTLSPPPPPPGSGPDFQKFSKCLCLASHQDSEPYTEYWGCCGCWKSSFVYQIYRKDVHFWPISWKLSTFSKVSQMT